MTAPSRPVRYTATTVSAIYAVALYTSGFRLAADIKQLLAYLPAAATLTVIAFDAWMWKWPGIHQLVQRPRIDGTWLTTLTPHPDSHIPDGGNRGPIDGAILIEQTYWTVHVTLLTAESRSNSTSAAIHKQTRQQSVLAYTFANEPDQQHRPRSQPHIGASRFNITGRIPEQMNGTYWTDRLTVGDMVMRFLNRETDYSTLAAVTAAAGTPAPAPTPQPRETPSDTRMKFDS